MPPTTLNDISLSAVGTTHPSLYFSSWSPDSKMIAFESGREYTREIYVMNADGSGLTNLTNNPADDRFPSLSPDGEMIVIILLYLTVVTYTL